MDGLEKAKIAYKDTAPEAKKAFEDLFGKENFKESVMSRIKTVDDVLNDNGIERCGFEKKCNDISESTFAQEVIKLLCISLNEGWTPNWDDSKERKYYPWFEMGSSGFRSDDYDCWHTGTYPGSRLCFKSAELAKYAGEQFKDVYEQYMVIR